MNENTKNEAATVSVICCDIAFSVNWRLHGLSALPALRENWSRQCFVLFLFFLINTSCPTGIYDRALFQALENLVNYGRLQGITFLRSAEYYEALEKVQKAVFYHCKVFTFQYKAP